MPEIRNVTLEIVENGGAAAALVTYSLLPHASDGPHPSAFDEKVELVGLDESVGEKGADKVIPGIGFQGSVSTPLGILRRSRLMAIPSSLINEDNRFAPFDFTEDEIQARVTLARGNQVRVTGTSNIVRRGGLLGPVILAR